MNKRMGGKEDKKKNQCELKLIRRGRGWGVRSKEDKDERKYGS